MSILRTWISYLTSAAAKKDAEGLNPQLNGVIVACETALNGTEAGMTEARKRTGSENDLKSVLKTAGDMLMRARKYPAAAELMAAARPTDWRKIAWQG